MIRLRCKKLGGHFSMTSTEIKCEFRGVFLFPVFILLPLPNTFDAIIEWWRGSPQLAILRLTPLPYLNAVQTSPIMFNWHWPAVAFLKQSGKTYHLHQGQDKTANNNIMVTLPLAYWKHLSVVGMHALVLTVKNPLLYSTATFLNLLEWTVRPLYKNTEEHKYGNDYSVVFFIT